MFITPVYDDVKRQSMYQNVPHFIWSKTRVLNVITVTYSLH